LQYAYFKSHLGLGYIAEDYGYRPTMLVFFNTDVETTCGKEIKKISFL
jgi:hypothetical protein